MRRLMVLLAVGALVATAIPAGAADPPDFAYETPLFGLNATSDGHLLVADAGQASFRSATPVVS